MKLKNLLTLLLLFAAFGAFASSPKYIFYFIGDGMGMGQIMSAQTYNRLVLGNQEPLNMMQLPVSSFATTYSLLTPVTDSAAAGTALSTGHKTKNGMLGMDGDTVAVYSIAKHLHEAGYGVGLVTTVALDDATPGAFYAHVPNRSHFYDIGRQAGESGFEVIGGAPLRGAKGNDLTQYIESCGMKIVNTIDDMRASDSRRIMIYPENPAWEGEIGYAADYIPGAMTIAGLTSATLDHLMKHTPEKFFIMSEGGSIDHAGHSNDGGTVVKETLAFDEAIGVALDFYRQHPDETLIIITADHETGGMSVGNKTTGYNAYLQYVEPQRISKDMFTRYCDSLKNSDKKPTWDEMKQFLTDKLGFYTVVPINEKNDKKLQDSFKAMFELGNDERQQTLYGNYGKFPVVVFEVLNNVAGIGWTTGSHTGNPVPVFAIGVGAEEFTGNNLDNTDLPRKIAKITGIDLK